MVMYSRESVNCRLCVSHRCNNWNLTVSTARSLNRGDSSGKRSPAHHFHAWIPNDHSFVRFVSADRALVADTWASCRNMFVKFTGSDIW